MTEIYLGYPPENVKAWILAHSAPTPTPAEKRETVFYFTEGDPEEKLIEGALGYDQMDENGYYDADNDIWIKQITKVEIGTGVTSIGWDVFSSRGDLSSVTIPSSVTSIEDGAFDNCRNLTTITLPSSVTSIGAGAFGSDYGQTIHVPNNTIKALVEDSGFEGTIVVD